MPKGRTKKEIAIKEPENFKNIVMSLIDRRMLPEEFAAQYEINTASNRSNFTKFDIGNKFDGHWLPSQWMSPCRALQPA